MDSQISPKSVHSEILSRLNRLEAKNNTEATIKLQKQVLALLNSMIYGTEMIVKESEVDVLNTLAILSEFIKK